jgi:nitroreductase
MIDWIQARRSIREYTSEPVSEEQIRTLLEAAMAAPSASNIKPWEFVVVRDGALMKEISEVHRYAGMAADAAVVFVVCGRQQDSRHWVEDCSAATQNLLLAATALGLGAVWVAMYPHADREDQMRRILHVPADWRTLCIIPVGHPGETKPERTKYDPARVHYDAV